MSGISFGSYNSPRDPFFEWEADDPMGVVDLDAPASMLPLDSTHVTSFEMELACFSLEYAINNLRPHCHKLTSDEKTHIQKLIQAQSVTTELISQLQKFGMEDFLEDFDQAYLDHCSHLIQALNFKTAFTLLHSCRSESERTKQRIISLDAKLYTTVIDQGCIETLKMYVEDAKKFGNRYLELKRTITVLKACAAAHTIRGMISDGKAYQRKYEKAVKEYQALEKSNTAFANISLP
ncbi:MAG: hypothetical protein S4CHLAM102_14630 [Chlamydiia bacterium]|nr:hypothetical protein [Chlamydiia bacterium]